MTQEERDEKKIKNVGKHIGLEKQKLHSLLGRQVTPWSSYNQAIIYIDIYTYIYVCCIINNILTDKVESDKENMADEENSDWLHKNDSSQPMQWNKHALGIVFDYMMVVSYYIVA